MVKEKFISAIIGTLFFAVFQPFGMSHFGTLDRLWMICCLFVIGFASCLISEAITIFVLRLPYPSSNLELIKRNPKYIFKRAILFQTFNVFFLTILISLFLTCFVNNKYVDNSLSIENCLRILIACIGCCFFIGLYWHNVYWKRHYAMQLEEAQLLNGVLMERSRLTEMKSQSETIAEDNTNMDGQIVLEGSTKESVSLTFANFLFAEAEGNYVSIHHVVDGKEKQSMLRISMKNVVRELCINSNIMQCHRAFVVNLFHVECVEGRSSGIGLRLRYCETIVPVSKSYVNEVKERIKDPGCSSQK